MAPFPIAVNVDSRMPLPPGVQVLVDVVADDRTSCQQGRGDDGGDAGKSDMHDDGVPESRWHKVCNGFRHSCVDSNSTI